MKRFAVYLTPDENLEKTVFIQEGFSFKAFIFTLFWIMYNKLYFVSFLLLALITIIQVLLYNGYISNSSVSVINLIGIQLFCGYNAIDWVQHSLLKKKFKLASIVFAKNLNEAQIKFFSEYNTTQPNHEIRSAW